MVIRCLLICCILWLFSCKDTYQLENKELNVEMSIDNISDSIYFSDLWSLSCIDNKLFFVDQRTTKIFVMSNNFSSCKFWGEAGHAGNEFSFLAGVHPQRDSIYAFDGGRQVIFIYDVDGNLLNQYQFKNDEIFFSREYRCIIKDKQLIGGAYTVKNGCMSIDMVGHNVIKWGKVFDFKSKKQEMLRNGRHLFLLNDIYFAVSDNLPVIESYDQKYELISEYNYSNIDFVYSRLRKIEQTKGGENSYSILCYDAYLYNQSLYLLMTGWDNGRYSVNKIIELKIEGNSIIPDKVLSLPGQVYSTICINEKGIFAYNKSDSRLELLNL